MSGTCRCGCGEMVRGQWAKGHNFRMPHKRGVRVPYEPKPEEIPSGFCRCGCGERTKIAAITNRSRGIFQGHPMHYVNGHGLRGRKGDQHPAWKGGRVVRGDGYVALRMPDHPDADVKGYISEHRFVAEQKIGRRLMPFEQVHHINGIKDDNRPENLVVLTHKQHAAIHGPERNYDSSKMSAAGKKGAAARWGKKEPTA